jgi:hypothetical protein
MSQMPGGVSPINGTRRQSVGSVAPVEITQSLDAPGLAVMPPVSRGAQLAMELERSLGLVGQVAGQVDSINRRNAIDARYEQNQREQAARDAKQFQEHEDTVLRGHGSKAASQKLPLFIDAIDKGQEGFQIADNPETGADTIIASATANMSPMEAQGFRDSIRDNLIQAGVNRRNKLLAEAQNANADDLFSFVVAGNPPEQAVTTGKALGLKQDEIDNIIIRAGNVAATANNKPLLESVRAQLSDRNKYAAEIQVQDAHLTDAQNREDTAAVRQFSENLSTLELNGASFWKRRMFIEQTKGTVPDYVRNNAVKALEQDQVNAANQANKAANESWLLNTTAQVNASDVASFKAGMAPSIQDIKIAGPDKEHEFTREKRIKSAMSYAFAEIDKAYPSDPRSALAEKIDLSARNGVPIPEAVDTLNAGGMAMTTASTKDAAAQLPPASVAGFGLFKTMRDLSPGYVDRLPVADKTREFYTLATTLQETRLAGDDSDALRQAAIIQANPRPIKGPDLETFSSKVSSSLNSGWFTPDIENAAAIANKANEYGRLFIMAGKSPEEAATLAIDRVKQNGVVANKTYIPLTDSRLTNDAREFYPQVSEQFANLYANSVRPAGVEANVVDPTNFVLEPRGSVYILIDKMTGLPASASSRFTADEVNARASTHANTIKDEILRRGQFPVNYNRERVTPKS